MVGEVSGDLRLLKIGADGSTVWDRSFGEQETVNDAALANNDSCLVAGSKHVEGRTGDAWVFKIDTNGEVVWETS